MFFSSLYLLPAVAIAILLQGTWVKGTGYSSSNSRRHGRRIRARAVFLRFLVVALVMATIATRKWPVPGLGELAQGTMITVVLMIPVCLYLCIRWLLVKFTVNRKSSDEPVILPSDEQAVSESPARSETLVLQGTESESATESRTGTDTVTSTETASETSTETATETATETGAETATETGAETGAESETVVESESVTAVGGAAAIGTDADSNSATPKITASKSHSRRDFDSTNHVSDNTFPGPAAPVSTRKPTPVSLHSQEAQESLLDQTIGTSQELETLDELVEFHDLGEESYLTEKPERPVSHSKAVNSLDNAIAIARDAILGDSVSHDEGASDNLPAKSREELAQLVVNLRSDKLKLQKLIIAQKAAIDAEKMAHDRTRVVVKDAISVMRHARHGQRMAEKIARRERAERLRLEKDYQRVQRALDNALSTLKVEESEVEH